MGHTRGRREGVCLALAHFPQRVADPLLGLASLPLFLALLSLHALQR
jgi:hypothetical protein